MSRQELVKGNGRATELQIPLSGRKAQFVAHYLMGASGGAAAIAAGYAQPSSRSTAWRLLHRDEAVMQAIREGQNKIREVAEVTTESMLSRSMRIALSPSRPRTRPPR
jgi:phage terminase small subunit